MSAVFADTFVILERELPRPPRAPGWLGSVLALIVSGVMFYAGTWIWVLFLGWAFGIRPAG